MKGRFIDMKKKVDKKILIFLIFVILNLLIIEYLIFQASQEFDFPMMLIRAFIIISFGLFGCFVGFKVFNKIKSKC